MPFEQDLGAPIRKEPTLALDIKYRPHSGYGAADLFRSAFDRSIGHTRCWA
jgi:hypothetical protein